MEDEVVHDLAIDLTQLAGAREGDLARRLEGDLSRAEPKGAVQRAARVLAPRVVFVDEERVLGPEATERR